MGGEAVRRAILRTVGALAETLPRPRRSGPARLLAIRPDHLGDVLLSTAALRALRAREPDAEIVALVGPWSAEVLRRSPSVDGVLTYCFPWFDRRPAALAERYAAAGALASWLRTLEFTRAYVLRTDHWWGAMAAALAGIPERLGYATGENAPFLTCALPRPAAHEHVARSALRLVAGEDAAQGATGEPPTVFSPSAADRAWGRTVEAEVIVHPGASTPLKRWPAERWGLVVEALRRDGLDVLLVGGPGEEALADEVASCASGARVLSPAPSLGQLGALFESARFAVGMDSAPMHLATAVGAATVRLVGPADERVFGPWGDPARHRTVRAPGTRPDRDWFAGGDRPHATLMAIEPELVLAEIAALRGVLG